MAQNFLFMFEFVVDEVLVTKPNYCAPEEYPLCCEITFRNSVYVSICDREFGQCVDPCSPKCGKSCVFSLETPISEADKLLVHIYKKKTEQCKFLIGCTDLPIKSVFDKVMENFNIENENWQDALGRHLKGLPNPKESSKPPIDESKDCDSYLEGRKEQLCPTSELTKHLLPIFNLKKCQTGNVVLLIRLVAIGPAMVSTFPFSRICNTGCKSDAPDPCDIPPCCPPPPKPCCPPVAKPCYPQPPKPCCPPKDCSRCCGGGNDDNAGCSNKCQMGDKDCPLRDPCHKEPRKQVCQRYFACNADRPKSCKEVEDECDRAAKFLGNRSPCCCPAPEPTCPNTEASNSCSADEYADECEVDPPCGIPDPFKFEQIMADECDDCVRDPCSPCGACMAPCFQTPRPPNPGPDAYDEFEACLNGSGLVIRVLKDTHHVEKIYDGQDKFEDECSKCGGKENSHNSNCSLTKLAQRNTFARNHIKRRTGGHIVNHPDLPKIRANIKYSGKDNCYGDNYYVPFSKIKTFCDNQQNKIDNYRTQRSKAYDELSCPPKQRKDEKNCCVQVDREDIKQVMKGLEVDTRKKGIEVCYKTCEETDSDVFLVKLGSKHKCEHKKNNIEIELKTPKLPVTLPMRHVTTETQINEAELDAALSDMCKKKKKGKGKKKK